MNVLVLRKKWFWQRRKSEEFFYNDIKVQIVYINKVSKKVRQMSGGFDLLVSLDFKEFFVKSNLFRQMAVKAYDKIASRHGGVDRDILEVCVDVLNEEIVEKLTEFALNVRRVIVHSNLNPGNFDFLCAEAGVCPEFEQGGFSGNLVVCFGEEFLIKHIQSGKIYYDIVPDAYFIPEVNMIFSEYIRRMPNKAADVKIRELMSK